LDHTGAISAADAFIQVSAARCHYNERRHDYAAFECSGGRPVSDYRFRVRWPWVVCLGFALLLLVGLLIPHQRREPVLQPAAASDESTAPGRPAQASVEDSPRRRSSRDHADAPQLTPEQIVASKVAQFGQKRRELVYAIAWRSQKEIPPEVEKFFDAIQSGNWENITNQWHELAVHSGQYDFSTNHWEDLNPYWPSVLDAYGVAEQAHLWSAQKLLDYGNAVLGSLRPGMVYVGGTDNGRWVPELLNETGDGEQHIIVTQNALADGRYLDFVNDLYSDRMSPLTQDDSQRAFADYVSDAQKRLEHDQQFPDEPKQVLPGEDIQVVDGKVQVKGQVAVMAINDRLLQMLMQKNPDMSFAIQQSFPFQDTYADALPLGPLMELNAQNDQNTFTAERAAQSLDYWRNAAQQVLSDVDSSGSETVLRSYSHDASAAANLLAAHNFDSQAEETYRLATQLWPGNPECVGGLANLLAATGREAEAQQLLDNFSKQYPDLRKTLENITAGITIAGARSSTK
jgi:hypothetical protein